MMEQKLIVTVCKGNIHRSVIAQLCLSQELPEKTFRVISRGIQGTMGTKLPKFPHLKSYEMEYKYTKEPLKTIGIKIPDNQKSTPIDEITVIQAYLILAMDRSVLDDLIRQFPNYVSKMCLFTELVDRQENIPDPCGKDDASLYKQVVMSIHEIAKIGSCKITRRAK